MILIMCRTKGNNDSQQKYLELHSPASFVIKLKTLLLDIARSSASDKWKFSLEARERDMDR